VIGVLDKPPMGFDMGPVEEVSSDSEGRFLLPHAPLGEVALRASAAGFELGESLIYLREDAENDLVLKPGKGRELVVTVDGVPADRLADIECNLFASRAFPMPSMALPPRLTCGRFDQKGRCIIQGLPRAPALTMIRLEADGMWFLPQWQKVEAGKDGNITFQL